MNYAEQDGKVLREWWPTFKGPEYRDVPESGRRGVIGEPPADVAVAWHAALRYLRAALALPPPVAWEKVEEAIQNALDNVARIEDGNTPREREAFLACERANVDALRAAIRAYAPPVASEPVAWMCVECGAFWRRVGTVPPSWNMASAKGCAGCDNGPRPLLDPLYRGAPNAGPCRRCGRPLDLGPDGPSNCVCTLATPAAPSPAPREDAKEVERRIEAVNARLDAGTDAVLRECPYGATRDALEHYQAKAIALAVLSLPARSEAEEREAALSAWAAKGGDVESVYDVCRAAFVEGWLASSRDRAGGM